MTTRWREGKVTVTLDGGLEKQVRAMIERAAGPMLHHLEAEAEKVAANARSQWYSQVQRRTGQSGDIRVVTTGSPSGVVVSIGSADPRVAKNGKPAVVYVRRPGIFSTVERPATAEEYHQRREAGMSRAQAYWVKSEQRNPMASDGKFLLPELVVKPARLMFKEQLPRLGELLSGGRR